MRGQPLARRVVFRARTYTERIPRVPIQVELEFPTLVLCWLRG